MKKIYLSLFTLFLIAPSVHSDNVTIKDAERYQNLPKTFWKEKLPKKVYKICREKGTEHHGPESIYADKFEKGTYMCRCCGGDFPLYKSEAKYDAGTGWPSFWAAIDGHVIYEKDRGWVRERTEVECARCHSHLGHVSDDGPKNKGGHRFCMNSAALTFVKEGEKPVRTFELP